MRGVWELYESDMSRWAGSGDIGGSGQRAMARAKELAARQ
jgi:hypothetical protein